MHDRADETPTVGEYLRDQLGSNTEEAPTEPGVYRLPCGECYVDFFISVDGVERWLVPGEATSYTRETVTIARHGEHPWLRLYSLQEAAVHLTHIAVLEHSDVETVVARLAQEPLRE